jgi:outer membrane protein assembly factor BamB
MESPKTLRSLRLSATALLTCILGALSPALAGDWPMWRYDSNRGGASPEELPEALHLQWFLDLPMPRPAWPDEQTKLQYDHLYDPILTGGLLIVPSMARDKVAAYDADTGEERWSFYAEGPVRFAAAAAHGKVFFVSDDGHLYCLRASDGALEWKFRGGPGDRKVIGNDRLISAWPARGAPVVDDGAVFFGASIWPFMGIFIHALEAESGAVLWTNSGLGSSYTVQQHDSPAFAGVAPHGYFAVSGGSLIVAGGRTVPAVLDRCDGSLIHYKVSSRTMSAKGGGGYDVIAGSNFFINRDLMYRLDNGDYISPAKALIVTPNAIIGHDADGIRAYRSGWEESETKDRRGRVTKKAVLKTSWTTPIDFKIERVFILSGKRLYATDGQGALIAVDLPSLDRGAKVSWTYSIPDQPLNMIAGDGKLFVSTDHGRVYCFGAGDRGLKLPDPIVEALVERGASWRYLDTGIDPGADWTEPYFDDSRWSSGRAKLGYGSQGERTRLRFGSDAKKKPMTCYFRHAFEAPADLEFHALDLGVLVDDGAVIHLNGAEIGRIFMPDGAVNASTAAEEGTDERTYQRLIVPARQLRPGRNVLAVEVHQRTADSSDLFLDLELRARRLEKQSVAGVEARDDSWTALAGDILRRSGARAGYALALGLGSGRLVEELIRQSDLHVIVLDGDRGKVDAFRRRMDACGVYGERVAALSSAPLEAELSPYFAELVVAEDAASIGLVDDAAALGRVFQTLRPISGAACFALGVEAHQSLERSAGAAALDGASLERSAGLSTLRRIAAPRGAADWTHQYADAANTVASKDRLVKLPLGLLWFGGPSNEEVLPRHGHGPAPHVVQGRVFIEGRHMLRAMDAYTGRVLWQKTLRDLGKFYDYSGHEPGANAIGSNYVSLPDGIYVIHGLSCLRLDPATGERVAEFRLPISDTDDLPMTWSYVSVWDKFLIAGAEPADLTLLEYTAKDFDSLKDEPLKKAVESIGTWRDFRPIRRRPFQSDKDYFLVNVNKLLSSEGMVAKIPLKVREEAKAEALEKKLESYLEGSKDRRETDDEAMVLKRQLLAAYYKYPTFERKAPGMMASLKRVGSRRLLGLDRESGKVLWQHDAGHQIRHNSIAIGGGKVFFIDRMSDSMRNFFTRRGQAPDEKPRVAALDVRDGRVLWEKPERVFGTWLGYSEEHDVLVEAGSQSRDRATDEVGRGLVAYRGASGEIVWQNDLKYNGPCVLIGDRVVTQGVTGTLGFALEISSGKVLEVPHPISGAPTRWQYSRNYGCNTAVGCPSLLAFRSAAAGYFDLERGGTGNFGGFRSGCTSNLIPAGGILNAPDYTRDCTCAYQNQSSLALVHMPAVELWTFNVVNVDGRPVRQAGLNFGAPGDRRAADGTLWLDVPSVGGTSPNLDVTLDAKAFTYHRVHSSAVEGPAGLEWVAASALEGDGSIAVKLRDPERIQFTDAAGAGRPLQVAGGSISAAVPAPQVPASGESNRASLGKTRGAQSCEALVKEFAELAAECVTVEFFARAAVDFDYVDARGGGIDLKAGFVFDNRTPRVRYFVANAGGSDNEPEVALESRTRLADGAWSHLAFVYDAADGVGRLYIDGKEAARHDGPDGRPLWWDSQRPELAVAKGIGENCGIDELRIAAAALTPPEFLNAAAPGPSPSGIVGYWRMEPVESGAAGSYSVKLVFAEIAGLEPGRRVFDVLVQGQPLLEGFDIAREAGGAFRGVVREFSGLTIGDRLRVQLRSRIGAKPMLSGIEVRLERGADF